jgi:hypothetical protein
MSGEVVLFEEQDGQSWNGRQLLQKMQQLPRDDL